MFISLNERKSPGKRWEGGKIGIWEGGKVGELRGWQDGRVVR